MPRSPNTYTLPPGTTPQVPDTPISSTMFNAAMNDLAAVLNAPWPTAIGVGAAGVTQSWDAINAKGADVASATSINLSTTTGPNLTITGTTTVTGVTLADGNVRFARAAAAFQLTASANLIVNKSTSVNYTTSADDLLIFIGGAGGVVRVWAIGGSVTAASLAETLAGVINNKYVSPATAYLPTGFVYGMTLTTNGTDAASDIDIAAGTARDSTDSFNLIGTAKTKQTDAAWAVGTNAGSLDTGVVGNSRYAVWGIGRSDTRATDYLTSLSFTSPTMPTNYDYRVLLGEFTRAGGVNGPPVWYGPRTIPSVDTSTLGIITPWRNYTPTFTGFGTASGIEIWSRRVGGNLEIRGRFTPGTCTAVEARVTLGFNGTNSNVTSSPNLITSLQQVGTGVQSGLTGNSFQTYALIETNVAYLTWGYQSSTSGGLNKANGNDFASSGRTISFMASVPILGW